MKVREARLENAPAIQAIYAPFVTDTIISFEEAAPDVAEMQQRIEAIQSAYHFLIAEADGEILGYAYVSQHRS